MSFKHYCTMKVNAAGFTENQYKYFLFFIESKTNVCNHLKKKGACYIISNRSKKIQKMKGDT